MPSWHRIGKEVIHAVMKVVNDEQVENSSTR